MELGSCIGDEGKEGEVRGGVPMAGLVAVVIPGMVVWARDEEGEVRRGGMTTAGVMVAVILGTVVWAGIGDLNGVKRSFHQEISSSAMVM